MPQETQDHPEEATGETESLAQAEMSPSEPVAESLVEPDLAPEPPASQEAADVPEPAPAEKPVRSGVPWWPFLAYEGIWVAFAVLLVWRLMQVPAGMAVYESTEYPLFLFGGLVLAASGPLLSGCVWLAVRARAQHRGALFVSALYRGSVVTFVGVIVWWTALLVLDQLRLGRLF